MLRSKRERLINELCRKAQLEHYRSVLSKIVAMIEDNGCNVCTSDIAVESVYSVTEGQTPVIRVGLFKLDKPLWVIFRMLHEYGHHLSGPKQEDDTPVYREELAWKHAETLLPQYPELVKLMAEYEACRAHDLASYYRRYGGNSMQ